MNDTNHRSPEPPPRTERHLCRKCRQPVMKVDGTYHCDCGWRSTDVDDRFGHYDLPPAPIGNLRP